MYLSIRDCLVSDNFDTPLDGLRHLEIENVEIELRRDFKVLALDSRNLVALETDGDAEAYRQHLLNLGVRPCALLTACDFSVGAMEENTRWVTRALELASLLDADCVRIDAYMSREFELDFETRVERFAGGLGEALRRTAGQSVAMGIENHGILGNNLAFLLNIFQRVGGERRHASRLGMTLDTGNFYWRGYPLSEVYGILRLLAPYAKHTHVKNIKYPAHEREQTREPGWEYGTYVCPIDEGDIDHARVLELLHAARYDGDICIEDESLFRFPKERDRVKALERDAAHLRKLLARLPS